MRQKNAWNIDQGIGAAPGIERNLPLRQHVAGFDAAAANRVDMYIFMPELDHPVL